MKWQDKDNSCGLNIKMWGYDVQNDRILELRSMLVDVLYAKLSNSHHFQKSSIPSTVK